MKQPWRSLHAGKFSTIHLLPRSPVQVQQSAHAQLEKLESLTRRLEALNAPAGAPAVSPEGFNSTVTMSCNLTAKSAAGESWRARPAGWRPSTRLPARAVGVKYSVPYSRNRKVEQEAGSVALLGTRSWACTCQSEQIWHQLHAWTRLFQHLCGFYMKHSMCSTLRGGCCLPHPCPSRHGLGGQREVSK